MADQLKPTSAAEFRRGSTFIVRVDDTLTIELKRTDMLTMIMNDAMPMPLLDAAMQFEQHIQDTEKQRKEQGLPPQTMAEQYAGMPKETLIGMLRAMRQYAIIHAVNPKIVPEGDNTPDAIPVTMLTPDQLMSIFYATPEGEKKEVAVLDKNEAIDFRGQQTDVPSVARQGGEEVRPSAKLLDLPKRECLSA